MNNNQLSSYLNEVKNKTNDIISEIIKLSHSNNSQKLLFLLTHVFNIELSYFSFEQITFMFIAIIKFIENNLAQADTRLFIKYLSKIVKYFKNCNESLIECDWKLFYKIFFIYSYDYENDEFDNFLMRIRPCIIKNFNDSDYDIVKKALIELRKEARKIED